MDSVTIKDIAKKCGVSVSTVSRAINDYPGISQSTKKRIMEAVRENQFIPNNSARNLRQLEGNSIVVLIKGIDNPFFQPMIGILEKIIRERKYAFILQNVNAQEDEIEVALELIREKKPKGIIFLGGYFYHAEEKIRQLSIPCVIGAVGGMDHTNGAVFSSVHVDDIQESYKIVDYLCRMGHKRIAMLAACRGDRSIGALRLEGYRRALADHGLPIVDELIRYARPDEDVYAMERGYQEANRLLAGGTACTAIYGISDTVAIGACRALKEKGKKIPGDYSIVGFDGLEVATFYIPTITTVRQPVEEMAQEVARILFDTIEKDAPVQHRIFDGELLVRESSDCLSAEW